MIVDADVHFQVDTPAVAGRAPVRTHGRISAAGQDIVILLDRLPSLAGAVGQRRLLPRMAAALHRAGLTLEVHGPRGPFVTIGASARPSRWLRLVTRTPYFEVVSWRSLLGTVGGPPLLAAAWPTVGLPSLRSR